MIPGSFEQQNFEYKAPAGLEGQCLPLPVEKGRDELTGMPYIRSCWLLSAEEQREVAATGRIFLDIMGLSQPMVRVMGFNPSDIHWQHQHRSAEDAKLDFYLEAQRMGLRMEQIQRLMLVAKQLLQLKVGGKVITQDQLRAICEQNQDLLQKVDLIGWHTSQMSTAIQTKKEAEQQHNLSQEQLDHIISTAYSEGFKAGQAEDLQAQAINETAMWLHQQLDEAEKHMILMQQTIDRQHQALQDAERSGYLKALEENCSLIADGHKYRDLNR